MINLYDWHVFLNTIEQEGRQIVKFGKYKDRTFTEVITDYYYCNWIRRQIPNGLEMFVLKQFIEKIFFIDTIEGFARRRERK